MISAAADRACSKAMRNMLPWLLLMYVLAYLDRANFSFGAAAGMANAAQKAARAKEVGVFMSRPIAARVVR